jgi:plastocyanin
MLWAAAPLSAQSLLYRSPNLGGTWTPDGGVVQFNFVHRFYVAPAPSRSVVNFPSFTLAAGLGRSLSVAYRFATRSQVVASATSTNESELSARWRFWGAPEGTPGLAVALTPAYNLKAKSFDAELSADYTLGALTVLGGLRELGKPFGAGGAQVGLAGGAVVRLTPYIALAGDYAKLLGGDTTAAWSAGLQVVIPGSPHTFALEVSNVASNTYQGSSRGVVGIAKRLYGFEFTIPLHLSRFRPWFHRAERVVRINQPLMNAAAAAEVVIEGLRFGTDTVTVSAGQVVKWVNRDTFEHTVTFNAPDAAHLSGALSPKGELVIRFDQPGTYPYHCLPHPTMKGVVVVR